MSTLFWVTTGLRLRHLQPTGGGSPAAGVTQPTGGGSPAARVTQPTGGGSPAAGVTQPTGGGSPAAGVTQPTGGGAAAAGVTQPTGGGSPAAGVTEVAPQGDGSSRDQAEQELCALHPGCVLPCVAFRSADRFAYVQVQVAPRTFMTDFVPRHLDHEHASPEI